MRIKGDLKFIYDSAENAKLVYDSLEVDNEDYLKSTLHDNSINYEITSEKLGTFLSTADDLISSEIVVEKIIEKTE